jgi:hypothetical protein
MTSSTERNTAFSTLMTTCNSILHNMRRAVSRNKQEREQQSEIVGLFLDKAVYIYAIFLQQLSSRMFDVYPGDKEILIHALDESRPVYAPRSLIHMLLEDGACIPLLFNSASLMLDVEYGDPLGRTLLLFTCRNPLGIDAAINSVITDISKYR